MAYHLTSKIGIAYFLFLAFFTVIPLFTKAQTKPNCAPGDVAVPVYDSNGNIIYYEGCLYGSDVVPCQEVKDGCPYGKPVTDLRSNIRIALNVIFGFLGIVVIVMIVYGAFEWLTSMGSDDKEKKGRDTMLWAAVGAVAIAVAWTVTSFILHTGRVVGS